MRESLQAENSHERDFLEGPGCGGMSPGTVAVALCCWERIAGDLTKGQCLHRVSEEAELLRTEISRVRIGGFSSSRTGVFSCSGIGGILWKAGGGGLFCSEIGGFFSRPLPFPCIRSLG